MNRLGLGTSKLADDDVSRAVLRCANEQGIIFFAAEPRRANMREFVIDRDFPSTLPNLPVICSAIDNRTDSASVTISRTH